MFVLKLRNISVSFVGTFFEEVGHLLALIFLIFIGIFL